MAITKNKEAELRPVYLDSTLHMRVRIHAATNDVSIRALVAEAIENHLKKQKAKA